MPEEEENKIAKPRGSAAPGIMARVAEDGILTVYSRKSERQRKKQEKRSRRPPPGEMRGLLDLPYELLVSILILLRPSDVFRLSRTSKGIWQFVNTNQPVLAAAIIARRYPSLAQCLPLPVPLRDVDPAHRALLREAARQDLLAIRKKPYQHVPPPDPTAVCTCLTCLFRWNSLCLAVDFADWQDNLDAGRPIPMIDRGKTPSWNRHLLARNAGVVATAALGGGRPLLYACILEAHLASTVRSIHRHGANKGNKRRRFRMTVEDERAGTDEFLDRSGPPTVDFPFHRDNYYMLEAYLPNRSWSAEDAGWVYVPADQHERDLVAIGRWVLHRRAEAAAAAAEVAAVVAGTGGG